MEIPGRDETGADVLQLVCEWLRRQSSKKWLLVLDNADDLVLLEDSHKKGLAVETLADTSSPSLLEFVPQTRNGLILVTTRNKMIARRLTGDTTSVLMVEPMLQQEARTLLHIMIAANWDGEDADQLLQALDCIPLALAQAAAFINETAPRFTMRKYLQEFRKERGAQAKLLYQDSFDLRREPSTASSIGVTWQLGFDRIREIAPSAARLLSLICMFQPDQIQDYLLVQYDEDNIAHRDHQEENNLQFEEDISILRNFCFIATNEQGDLFAMHRLVQLSMKGWLEKYGELERWKGKYLMIMSRAFPKHPYENWVECKALFPHAEVAMDYRPSKLEFLVHYTTILGNASFYARATGRYEVAEDMSKSALRGCETLLGQNFPLTPPYAQSLAFIVQEQGEYNLAEDMIRSSYENSKKVLGLEHPDTLASASILVSNLRLQGRLAECQNLVMQVLEVCQRTLGLEHQSTLSIMSNIARIHHDSGRDEEALRLQESVFESRQKILGVEHPLTLSAMADLPTILTALGRRKEAEELEMKVFERMIEVLGPEHPYTLSAMASLAASYSTSGREQEAQALSLQVLELRMKILREQHPQTQSAKEQLFELNQRVLREQHSEMCESESNSAEVNPQNTTKDSPVLEQERLHSLSLPSSPNLEKLSSVGQRSKSWSWKEQARNVRHWSASLRGNEQKADGSRI